jgi:hypothetical protein
MHFYSGPPMHLLSGVDRKDINFDRAVVRPPVAGWDNVRSWALARSL